MSLNYLPLLNKSNIGLIIKLLLTVFMLYSFSTAYGQTARQYTDKADEAYAEEDFFKAATYYQQALNIQPEKVDLNFKFAEASRQFNDYKNAMPAYEKVLSSDLASNFSLAEFRLAEMNKYLANYEKAKQHFSNFLKSYSEDDFFKRKAQNELLSCDFAIDLMQDTVAVKIEHLGSGINSPFSEFAAFEYKDSLISFSTIRESKTKELEEPQYLSRIYTYVKRRDKWKRKDSFLKSINESDLHVANGSFSPDFKSFYFTVCENVTLSKLRCDIFVSHYDGGTWSQAEKLPETINRAGYTSTHPFMAFENGRLSLFFASDRPGGKGGLDLYKSEFSGSFSEAVALGSNINTEGNESTPYFDTFRQTLYFSSDWHFGLGGYDNFKVENYNDPNAKPENLGFPINTSFNDLYFSVNPDQSEGLLTSNRLGSLFIKGETCCNDLFRFEWDSLALIAELAEPVDSQALLDSLAALAAEQLEPAVSLEERLRGKLPLAVYFHNDEPECCNLRKTTELSYDDTYLAYINMMAEYKKEYTAELAANDKETALQEIESLFREYVIQGMIDLNRFSDDLLLALKDGLKIQLTIQGYCSPLARNTYNDNLALRRIASLKNYFSTYQEGVFDQYLQNGQLQFRNEPFGESQANQSVSDDRLDTRNSVYHPAAAKERKVEIISIELSR